MEEEKKVKQGWKSTEWWTTVVVCLAGIAIAGGFLKVPESGVWGQVIGGVMATVTQGLYALSRAAVKSAAANASGQLGPLVGELLKKKISGGDVPPVQ